MIKKKERKSQTENKIHLNLPGLVINYYFDDDNPPLPILVYSNSNLREKGKGMENQEGRTYEVSKTEKKEGLVFLTEGSICCIGTLGNSNKNTESNNVVRNISSSTNSNTLESFFNNPKIKFKKWDFSIVQRMFVLFKDNEETLLQDLRYCFKQKQEYSNLGNNELDKILEFELIKSNIGIDKDITLKFMSISGKLNSLNVFTDFKILRQLEVFFDTLSYSLTLLQIFIKTQRNIYGIMKEVIFKTYSLRQIAMDFSNLSEMKIKSEVDNQDLKYNIINLELEEVNLILFTNLKQSQSINTCLNLQNKDIISNYLHKLDFKNVISTIFERIENPFLLVKIERVLFSNVIINKSLNKIGVFVNDLKCMMRKLPKYQFKEREQSSDIKIEDFISSNKSKVEKEYDVFYSSLLYDEFNFNYLVYKGNSSHNSSLIRVDIVLHNNTSNSTTQLNLIDEHQCDFFENKVFTYIGNEDNFLYPSYEDFISMNKLPQDDGFIQLGITLNEIVICPLYIF